MDKSPEAFRTISEVAEALETPAHVLRFWESRFPQIRPVKRAGGRRYYRPSDIALLAGIKRLLHDDGLTIRGVQKILREHGIRHVVALGGNISPEEAALEAAMAARPGADVPDLDQITPEEAAAATAAALDAALAALPDRSLPAAPDNVIAFPTEASPAEDKGPEAARRTAKPAKPAPEQFRLPGFDAGPEEPDDLVLAINADPAPALEDALPEDTSPEVTAEAADDWLPESPEADLAETEPPQIESQPDASWQSAEDTAVSAAESTDSLPADSLSDDADDIWDLPVEGDLISPAAAPKSGSDDGDMRLASRIRALPRGTLLLQQDRLIPLLDQLKSLRDSMAQSLSDGAGGGSAPRG